MVEQIMTCRELADMIHAHNERIQQEQKERLNFYADIVQWKILTLLNRRRKARKKIRGNL